MKRILILILLCFTSVCIAGSNHVNTQFQGDSAPSITYYHQFLLEQAYETTKVRDETTDSNIGTITGNTTFASACGSNGASFDNNGDYISFQAAELSNITNLNKMAVRWSYVWDGTINECIMFYQYDGNGDGPQMNWKSDNSRWVFSLFENDSNVITGTWLDSDAASGTCEYYELRWDYNNVLSSLALYKGNSFDNMSLQSTSTETVGEGTGTVGLSNGFSISQSSSKSAAGEIGEMDFIDPDSL